MIHVKGATAPQHIGITKLGKAFLRRFHMDVVSVLFEGLKMPRYAHVTCIIARNFVGSDQAAICIFGMASGKRLVLKDDTRTLTKLAQCVRLTQKLAAC